MSLRLEHLAVVGVSVLLSTVIGIGLGIATYRTDRPREIALGLAGIFLTIPSFALFILLISPLGLGAKPVVVALTLYGLVPILRNTITGLSRVGTPVAANMVLAGVIVVAIRSRSGTSSSSRMRSIISGLGLGLDRPVSM